MSNQRGNIAIVVAIALFAVVVGTGFATAYYVNNQRAEAKKNAPSPTPTPSSTANPTNTPKATHLKLPKLLNLKLKLNSQLLQTVPG